MMRGTFANIRIRNEMARNRRRRTPSIIPWQSHADLRRVRMQYQDEGVPLIVVGGKEYGTGSSRDWAAKGTVCLGIKAVIVESFERIHRSNLVGMGVLPLQFKDGQSRKTLKLDGTETLRHHGHPGVSAADGHRLHDHRADGHRNITLAVPDRYRG